MTLFKKKTYYFFIFFIALISCDIVKNVNPPIEPTILNINPIVIYKKILLEKYTGHKCGNCPASSDLSNTLQNQYQDKIISLSIHAGFFATTNTTYPTDFRTNAGTIYDTQFGISAAGNPNGLVNRGGYNTASFIKSPSAWGSYISQSVNQVAKFEIKIKNNFNSNAFSLTSNVTVKSLAINNGNYKLVVLLTEDSIVAEQIDYRLPTGSQLISNYIFRHVLRGAINSEWGDAIFLTQANANDSVVKVFSNYSINSTFKVNKCYVVAFVYDANSLSTTYNEVLQVEEKRIR